MMLYHRTNDAHALLEEGFQDTDISNVVGRHWAGLWLCEDEYNVKDYLYGADVISFDIPEDIVNGYQDKPLMEVEPILAQLACRFFLIPASILNQYPPTIMSSEEFEDIDREFDAAPQDVLHGRGA